MCFPNLLLASKFSLFSKKKNLLEMLLLVSVCSPGGYKMNMSEKYKKSQIPSTIHASSSTSPCFLGKFDITSLWGDPILACMCT